MKSRHITNGVKWLGAVDWDRRLFDSLIPLPDGTSYNAYLIAGSEKTALVDTVDPPMTDSLLRQLEEVPRIDYVISNHAEKDHSGAIPAVLNKYPDAKLLCSEPAKPILIESMPIAENRVRIVEDGERISLGDKNLTFIYTPWVHWPETMGTYLEEDRILFSCDFFGSHIAQSELYVNDKCRVEEAAKRYFAEIMMPFSAQIRRNLDKLSSYKIDMIAPSHGPIHKEPSFIVDAYRDWAGEKPKNLVVVPFVSMHGSTAKMVKCLVNSLIERGVEVRQFELSGADIGKLAMALVDAATIVVATPTVLAGPHPLAAYAAFLANALRPKAKFLSVIGSYGWGGKTVETLAGMIPNLKVEVLEPVLNKGLPGADTCDKIRELADKIAAKHRDLGLVNS